MWLVRDSGAVFTIETTRNSELFDTIFINFALKMVGRSYVKVLQTIMKIRPHYERISKILSRG